MSGTSSLVVGKGNFSGSVSTSSTTNGVGNAYGDGSNIQMSPYQSSLHDPANGVMNQKSNPKYLPFLYNMFPGYLYYHPYNHLNCYSSGYPGMV